MKIEVFKEFGGGWRYFDSEVPDYVTWRFNSINKRDLPPEFINPEAPGDQAPDTIYFDSTPGRLTLTSTLENVVLDYRAPESVLQYLKGDFNAFRDGTDNTWNVETYFKDDSGIDTGAYRIYVPGDNEVNLVNSSRESSTGPSYEPSVDPASPQEDLGIKITFEQSTQEKSMYKMRIDIDPKKLSEAKPEAIKKCNDYISYLTLAVDLWDIAGNQLQFKFPDAFVLFEINQDTLVRSLSQLKISFADTYPLNMLIGKDEIGRTTAVVENLNVDLAKLGLTVKIELAGDSVGYLDPSGREDETYDPDLNQESLTTIQKIDGIDRSGYVHVFAYMDSGSDPISCEISGEDIKLTLDKNFGQRVKNATWSEGTLGKFITECADNTRKLFVEPFIPSVLKHEELFGLCKLFERYLNTMYTKMSGDCRIGILEKTHRISEFKNIDKVEPELIGYFAREHGSELTMTDEDIKKASEVLKKYAVVNFNTTDIVERVYRRLYKLLPYIDQRKGNLSSFDIIFNVLGISAKIYPLWEDPFDSSKLRKKEDAGKDWMLSGHDSLELSEKYDKEDVQNLAEFTYKAAKSILPITRVISYVTAVDKTEDHYDKDTGEDKEKDTNTTISDGSPNPISNDDESIQFTWNSSSLVSRSDAGLRNIDIPCYADNVERVGSGVGNLPDMAGFFLNRWFMTKKTMDSCPLKLKFNTTTITLNDVERISIERNRLRLTLKKTTENDNAMNSFNNLRLTTNLTIKFKFNRAVKNYCISE